MKGINGLDIKRSLQDPGRVKVFIVDLSAFELEDSKRRVQSLEESLLKVYHEKQEYVKSLEELNSKFEYLNEQEVPDASWKESLCDDLVDQPMSESTLESSIVDRSLTT